MGMAEARLVATPPWAGEFRLNEPMRKHTSWRVGGPAARAYFPRSLQDLAAFLRSIPSAEPVLLVGLGSNLLVRDGGIRGTVVFTHGALKQMHLVKGADGVSLVYAEAGVASPKVARFAATNALRGGEFLAGIPGTVGGALAMNAGCFGSECWDAVERVLTVSRDGQVRRRGRQDYEIGYRHVALHAGERQEARREKVQSAEAAPASSSSSTPSSEEYFAAAWFRFAAGDPKLARTTITELLQRRIDSQPLEQPNAGSVFRNPPGDYAARLIESCGLKGFAIGGAMVSTKHANFIVNTGAATAADIEALIEHVRQTVQERCGVALEREVRIVGEATGGVYGR
jgi:UDP-N-acetylmuramate dehydrogenase